VPAVFWDREVAGAFGFRRLLTLWADRSFAGSRGKTMRVMLLIKGDPEPGAMPSQELFEAMGRYNDELRDAGVLLDLTGLHREW
jgi:hypothetical protein